MATVTDVRGLLGPTSLPGPLVEGLLDGASALWMMGETAEQLAADLALCHPPLAAGEVRALAVPLPDGVHRLAIACTDRPGLLAATAGALAAHGLSITSASASTWPDLDLAVQRVVTAGGIPADWDAVGADLRAALGGTATPSVRFVPAPPVAVEATAEGAGRTMVSVRAPDRVGLLWAIASWFAEQGANIEVARVGGEDGVAVDTFVVCPAPERPVDAEALASHLSGQGRGQAPPFPLLAFALSGFVLATFGTRLVWRVAQALVGSLRR